MSDDQADMKEIMNLLEAEPSSSRASSAHAIALSGKMPACYEQLAIRVSTGKAKDAIGTQLTHDKVKHLSDKDVKKYYRR